MIIFILKFIHLISLFFAGGGAIGSAVIQSIYKKEGKVPEPHLAKGFRILAFLSLLAVITMWVTGLIMLISIYGSFNLGWKIDSKFDLSKASANFADGLLTIDVPFSKGSELKKLQIK